MSKLLLGLILSSITLFSYTQPVEIDETIQKELSCLAIAIHHEALDQSYSGKLAVGNVIMNRTKNGKFPSDVCSVVKQKTKSFCQFSFVCTKNWTKVNPSAEIQQLAFDLVVNKDVADNTNGSLFFHHIGIPEWSGLKKTKIIGSHVFYKFYRKNDGEKRKYISRDSR